MSDFVPSYKNEEERLKIRKKKDRKDRIKQIVIFLVVIAVIAGIGILSYTLANLNYSKYEQFKEKMDIYGFSQVYDNGTCTTRDKVTKSEAVKMILACVYNVSDIEGIAIATDETYSNAIWVEYAIKQGIVSETEVNADTADDYVKYQEVLVWLYNIKAKILDLEPDTTEVEGIKDINAYNADQKLAIYDLVNSEVITVSPNYIKGNKTLYKGKLNELIVNFAEVYNTITVGDARININSEKIPENASDYPYTLANVDKSVYEIDFVNSGTEAFISPVNIYATYKEYYAQIKSYVESYYTYLLNIDYNDLSVEKMKRNLKKYAISEFDDDVLSEYVDYVKANNIILSSTVTAQLPCVYFDGEDFRVRVKIELSILNSNTNKNIIYYDLEYGNIEYNDTEYTIYADIVMNKGEDTQTLFVKERTIYSMIVKSNNTIVATGD